MIKLSLRDHRKQSRWRKVQAVIWGFFEWESHCIILVSYLALESIFGQRSRLIPFLGIEAMKRKYCSCEHFLTSMSRIRPSLRWEWGDRPNGLISLLHGLTTTITLLNSPCREWCISSFLFLEPFRKLAVDFSANSPSSHIARDLSFFPYHWHALVSPPIFVPSKVNTDKNLNVFYSVDRASYGSTRIVHFMWNLE